MAHAIVWFRRDLRLADNPALQAALDAGHAPIPLYIHAPGEEAPWAPGAASQAWLQRSLQSLAADLQALGSRLLLRQGPSLAVLEEIIAGFDVGAVYWNRLYEPQTMARDTRVKDALKAGGVHVESFNAALLVEPWTVATGAGEPYRVFTPFWRNVSQRVAGQPVLPTPAALPALPPALTGIGLDQLHLAPALGWDGGFWQHWQPGEAGAAELLEAFVDGAAHGSKEQRNFPDRTGSSKLSPHLHFGEISPRQICARMLAPSHPPVAAEDQAHYLSELGWREFSHHLLFHYPHTPERDLTAKFEHFPWAPVDEELLARWQQGRTGVPLVDAGMRELWQTGWMHNRVRMVVASFLSKNLRYHWSHGARWFWDTLVDADAASNPFGWQWVAGSGADAAPYFRIFNPELQAAKFDPHQQYIREYVPEYGTDAYPEPLVDLGETRRAALAAYEKVKAQSASQTT